MYAETILQRFQPELSHHMLQRDDSCFLQSNAWASDYRTISEYDLGEDASIFTASDLLPVENPIMELDPAVFSLSSDTIKISDIGSIPNDQLLDEVFGDCEDLLKDTRVEDAFPELSETVIPSSLSVNSGEVTPAKVEEEQNLKPKAEEEISVSKNEKVTAGTLLQKSESSNCLSSMDWVNGPEAQATPSFLGIPGMDLGAVFGMRRAYSEGDIQTLMNHLNVSLVHSPFERLIPLGDPKLEDRMQKLSRYRKKKTKRNFDRKIKYACRKALADSQPRIRGRFAKTEEGEMTKSSKAPSS